MKEERKDRIKRLRARKGDILAQIKQLQGNPDTRNLEHKVSRLDDQVRAIDERVIKLET